MSTRNVAFLVGIDEFNDKSLAPLRFCQNDVTGMARVLRDPSSDFSIIEIRNKKHDEVLELLERTVAPLSPGDKLLFYFAGHGRRSPQSGRLYLVATDTKTDALRATGIPIDSTLDIIRESRCNNRALVLDCCYSGAVGEGFRGGDTASGLETLAEKNAGTYILTASTAIELAAERESIEGGSAGNGIFTKYFIEALETGNATASDSDEITIDAIHDYIQQRLTNVASQQPQRFVIGGAGRYVLGHSSSKRWEQHRDGLKRRLSELLYQNIISDEQYAAASAICRTHWQGLTTERKRIAAIGIDVSENKAPFSELLDCIKLLNYRDQDPATEPSKPRREAGLGTGKTKSWNTRFAIISVGTITSIALLAAIIWNILSNPNSAPVLGSNCRTVPP
jgi:hypothetical protein